MTTVRIFASLLLAAFAHGDASAAAQTAPSPPLAAVDADAARLDTGTADVGRALSRRFLDGEADALWARFSPGMRAVLPDPAALAKFRGQVAAQLGDETAVVREATLSDAGTRVYVRIAHWSKVAAAVEMRWAFDAEGRVLSFHVRPVPQEAPVPYADRETRADLRLPFAGDWYVFWGGRTIAQNYHAVDRAQRFAYDFLRRIDGRSHRGDGRALSDYYCWDEPVLAPAAGRVIEAVSDRPDQAIGTSDTSAPAGNHVVLDLGHGEYLVIAHLRAGSVAVRAGDAVVRGAPLGRCGNSGNTSEPHVHLHLQDTPTLGRGDGLPAFFNDYVADGRPVRHGEPVRGETIRAR